MKNNVQCTMYDETNRAFNKFRRAVAIKIMKRV